MRLVTYSWLAVVIAVICAAIGWMGLAGWMAAVVGLASVGMHVAGNALGTRMREAADRDRARLPASRSVALPSLAHLPTAAPTRLERREALGQLLPVSAGIGGMVGGGIGTVALLTLTSSSPAGAVLGGVSSAVIGGLLGFLVTSFVEMFRTTLRDAIAAERSDRPPVPSHRD